MKDGIPNLKEIISLRKKGLLDKVVLLKEELRQVEVFEKSLTINEDHSAKDELL